MCVCQFRGSQSGASGLQQVKRQGSVESCLLAEHSWTLQGSSTQGCSLAGLIQTLLEHEVNERLGTAGRPPSVCVLVALCVRPQPPRTPGKWGTYLPWNCPILCFSPPTIQKCMKVNKPIPQKSCTVCPPLRRPDSIHCILVPCCNSGYLLESI